MDTDTLWGDTESSGMITNVFDTGAIGVRENMYRAWVRPDLYPDEPQPVLKNWHSEDLAAYCGGIYTTLRNTNRSGGTHK